MINPLSLALVPAASGLFTAVAAVPVTLYARFLLRRARRRNREVKCGTCGRYLPFTAEPDAMFVLAGSFLCARCGRRGRRLLNVVALVVPPALLAFGGLTVFGIVTSGLPLSWWLRDRLIFALLPSFGVLLGLGLAARALKRANADPAVPAYDSVVEALDEERRRRERWALPGA
ncbi:MAG: hypothetical protein AB1762_03935 [Gemmatimonadota bacterium]